MYDYFCVIEHLSSVKFWIGPYIDVDIGRRSNHIYVNRNWQNLHILIKLNSNFGFLFLFDRGIYAPTF
jgi:hypothetical protein